MSVRRQIEDIARRRLDHWIDFYEKVIPEHMPEPDVEVLPHEVIVFIWHDRDDNYVLIDAELNSFVNVEIEYTDDEGNIYNEIVDLNNEKGYNFLLERLEDYMEAM